MDRRKFLIGTGSIGAAAIGGLAMFGGSASAEVSSKNFHGATISGTSDDGKIDDVIVTAEDVTFGYDGLDDEADFAAIALSAGGSWTNSVQEILDVKVFEDLSGLEASDLSAGSFDGALLEHNPNFDASDFEASEDGGTASEVVKLKLTVVVFYDSELTPDRIGAEPGDSLGSQLGDIKERFDGFVVGQNKSNLKVTVNNEPEKATVGGDAGGDVQT